MAGMIVWLSKCTWVHFICLEFVRVGEGGSACECVRASMRASLRACVRPCVGLHVCVRGGGCKGKTSVTAIR